jgi:TetR/AcrR family transcriptional repressor of mexJK operon
MRSPKRPLRGRPTQDELERRKQRVIDTATRLFMDHGYAGTSVAEIAKSARVSPRMIASHFGDKADIFTQVINERTFQASQLAEETANKSSIEEILFGAAKFAWISVYSPGALAFTRFIVAEGGRFADVTSQICREASMEFYGAMNRIFIGLYERGLIRRNDHEKTAKYFVDLMVGIAIPHAAMGFMDYVPDDDELREKIRFFCRGWLDIPYLEEDRDGHRAAGTAVASLL